MLRRRHLNTCRRVKIREPGRINFRNVLESWLCSLIDNVRKSRDDDVGRAWKQRTRAARPLSLTREFFIKSTYILAGCDVARLGGIDLFLITRATLYTYRRIENAGSFVCQADRDRRREENSRKRASTLNLFLRPRDFPPQVYKWNIISHAVVLIAFIAIKSVQYCTPYTYL